MVVVHLRLEEMQLRSRVARAATAQRRPSLARLSPTQVVAAEACEEKPRPAVRVVLVVAVAVRRSLSRDKTARPIRAAAVVVAVAVPAPAAVTAAAGLSLSAIGGDVWAKATALRSSAVL